MFMAILIGSRYATNLVIESVAVDGYLIDSSANYLVDSSGNYLMGSVA